MFKSCPRYLKTPGETHDRCQGASCLRLTIVLRFAPASVVTEHLRALQARIAGRANESPEAPLSDLICALVKASV